MICVMKTNEKYIAPESEEIAIKFEGSIAASCEGHTQGNEGCSDDTGCDFE